MNKNIPNTYGLMGTVADLFDDLVNETEHFYNWGQKRSISSKIEKNDEGYSANIELPGYNKENLSIKVENDNLLVVRSGKEDENQKILYRLQLTNDIDFKKITAKSEDGVLHLSLPVASTAKNKCITIE